MPVMAGAPNDWRQGRWIELPSFIVTPLSNQTNGVLGGIQAGANLQLNNWVLGIEADLAFMHADNTGGSTFQTVVHHLLGLPGQDAPKLTGSRRSLAGWVTLLTAHCSTSKEAWPQPSTKTTSPCP